MKIMFFSDESGCEADMAEGGAEEESGDNMLGPATAPAHQSPAAINVKAEVRKKIRKYIFHLDIVAYVTCTYKNKH